MATEIAETSQFFSNITGDCNPKINNKNKINLIFSFVFLFLIKIKLKLIQKSKNDKKSSITKLFFRC